MVKWAAERENRSWSISSSAFTGFLDIEIGQGAYRPRATLTVELLEIASIDVLLEQAGLLIEDVKIHTQEQKRGDDPK